jgi:hypothetical protein
LKLIAQYSPTTMFYVAVISPAEAILRENTDVKKYISD